MAVNRIKLAAFMSTAADPKYRWGDDPLSDMTAVRVADALLACYRILPPDEQEVQIAALTAENERLREALRPFAEFANDASFDRLPNETPMTQGSPMARRQVTAGAFKAARAALGIDGTGDTETGQ